MCINQFLKMFNDYKQLVVTLCATGGGSIDIGIRVNHANVQIIKCHGQYI